QGRYRIARRRGRVLKRLAGQGKRALQARAVPSRVEEPAALLVPEPPKGGLHQVERTIKIRPPARHLESVQQSRSHKDLVVQKVEIGNSKGEIRRRAGGF